MTKKYNMTSGADYLNASGFAEDIYVQAWAGNDIVSATAFNDFLDGGNGADTLSGGAGDDTIYSGSGAVGWDSLFGGAGDDKFLDDSGKARMYGGQGDDEYVVTLMPGQLTTSYQLVQIIEYANEGYDRAKVIAFDGVTRRFDQADIGHLEEINITSYLANPDPDAGPAKGIHIIGNSRVGELITAQLNSAPAGGSVWLEGLAGNDTILGSGTRFILDGGDGNDVLEAGSANDRLLGGTGSDKLTGNAGADTLDGGAGNDTLDGGQGADNLVGGAGDDTYQVDEATDRVIEGAYAGTDTVITILSTYTLAANLENLSYNGFGNFLGIGNAGSNEIRGGLIHDTLRGGDGMDRLFGNLGHDSLDGGASSDALFGEIGNDTLDGGESWDILEGGSGNDLLRGGQGADKLTGGAGADTLTGGTDADRFVFTAASDSTTALRDRITDFQKGGIDLIDLSAIDANTTLAGNQAFTWRGRTQDVDIGRPMAGDLWARENGAGTELRADLNGDGTVDFAVTVQNAWWLSASDLVL